MTESTSEGVAHYRAGLLAPSPVWADAMPAGPLAKMIVTEGYASLVARDAYFWAWPLVNIYNRRRAFENLTQAARSGPVRNAPLNQLVMFTDFADPTVRLIAHPNQDVVYGIGIGALDVSAVVIQVPDFGDRFWMIAAYDTRADNFARLGKMYATTPGFYLLASPQWDGRLPRGITAAFRATTNTCLVAPRVFMDDTAADRSAVQDVLGQIMMYPVAEFDATLKRTDWDSLPEGPPPPSTDEEVKWVIPERFFDELPAVLADAPPLPGEEARYAQVLAVLEIAGTNPHIKDAMTNAAIAAELELVGPLFEFRNFGVECPHHWRTMTNGAAFGTDYFTRTAIAKSNILVNTAIETRYFYQDFDATGARLNGANRYTVTFAEDQTPPVDGFWSLTLYNQQHFFAANHLGRYSVGTKSRSLRHGPDGSLTVVIQAESPGRDTESNWLPSPADADFSITIRAYWPRTAIADCSWTPPPVQPGA